MEGQQGTSPTAEQRIAEELHELESLAAALLAARNALRDKAKNLYTSAQVDDCQEKRRQRWSTVPLQREILDLKEYVHTREQEIIRLTKELEAERRQHAEDMAGDHRNITAQRQRIAELEEDNLRWRKAHVCTDGCRPNEHLGYIGKDLVAELEEQNNDLRLQIEELKQAAPAECLTVHKLTRQLDVAHSQVSALQRRKEELHIRVAELAERLGDKDKALTLAQTSREYNRQNLLAARAEVERLDALAASRETALAESRELVTSCQRDLDTMADTVAVRTAELDRTRALLRSVTAERDAQQGAKQDAWERLTTIERIVREPAVEDALGVRGKLPQYAQTMANTIRAVRERLKGFS